MKTTHYRACNLCEAICGLEIVVDDGRIRSIRGDTADPFSRGYVCPKATALADLQEDPDRLRRPMRRDGDRWVEIDWHEACELAARRLQEIRQDHGPDAVAVYRGNPSVHNWGLLTHSNTFLKRLGTRNNYSATSVDQLPHHLVCLWMYGHQFLQPIPDIDRSQFLLFLGYNPVASNGSIMTVPDIRGRLKELRQRGGKLVVIDPRRTETAAIADRHHFIRPGTDAVLLLAMLRQLFAENLLRPGRLAERCKGLADIPPLLECFSPEYAARLTGIDAEDIRALTRAFAGAPSAAAHGRMGLSTQRFGTLCQWAIQVLNLLTGNLDREGGALLTHPAVMAAGPDDRAKGSFARRYSRVSAYPEFSGEFPVAALAEEILTPGEGRVRALFTVAGNPVLSTPNGRALDQALESLEFMVSVDIYLNETTRHAHLILPPTAPLEHDHYDLAFHKFAVRNTTRYSEPVLPKPAAALDDWEIFCALAEAHAALTGEAAPARTSPAQMLDFLLQTGPYGKAGGHDAELDLDKLRAHPHGIDLGPLRPSLAERLCTADGLVDCLPGAIPGEIERLVAEMDGACDNRQLLLIGRRHLRSNNSWMHNSHRLVKGPRRDRLLVHPDDLARNGIADGQRVTLRSRTGAVQVEVSASTDMMPGCVSLPHGWGHDRAGIRLSVAAAHAGVSANDLTDERYLDVVSGNAALNGIPVSIES